MTVGLGVEAAVKVARNATFEEETGGLLGGSLRLIHRVDIEAVNHLSGSIRLHVRERLPVTREDDDDVRVEIDSVEPAWEDYEPFGEDGAQPSLRGGHVWAVDVPGGGGARQLALGYTVKIASKHEVVGGNRREP